MNDRRYWIWRVGQKVRLVPMETYHEIIQTQGGNGIFKISNVSYGIHEHDLEAVSEDEYTAAMVVEG